MITSSNKHGIAGEAAKKRFEDLCLYFFSNFSTDASSPKRQNTARLQASVNQTAKMEFSWIKSAINSSWSLVSNPQVKQLQDDVDHHVFYYLYL
jgi:hypothetical protein